MEVLGMQVYARVYASDRDACEAWERAYERTPGLNISVFRFYIPAAGSALWFVAVVGEDATPELLDGGEEATLDASTALALVLRRIEGRPADGSARILVARYHPGCILRIPGGMN